VTVTVGLVICDEPATSGGWADLGSLAADAEAAGARAVWITDHLYWHRPTVDVIAGLQTLAAATHSCTIGPCVLQLPLRDVPSTAKSLAYVAGLAPGRVVAGVGVGEHDWEYLAAGKADRFHRRGALVDDGIDGLRWAWAADVDGRSMTPGGSVPIWIGGRSAAARRRAARRGEGWIPHFCRSPWLAEQIPLLARDLAEAGRPSDAVTLAAVVAVHVDGIEPDTDPHDWLGRLYALPGRAFTNVVMRGTARQIADELEDMAQVGVQHVSLVVAGDRPVDHLAAVVDALGS